MIGGHIDYMEESVIPIYKSPPSFIYHSSGVPRCSVPESHGAKLTRAGEEALWQAFFMAAPERRREFEPSSKRRKRRAVPWPDATA